MMQGMAVASPDDNERAARELAFRLARLYISALVAGFARACPADAPAGLLAFWMAQSALAG